MDCETSGLNPYSSRSDQYGNAVEGGARIFCWAYMTEKGEWGYHQKTKKSMRFLKRLLSQPDNTIIFHNAKFDLKMIGFEGIDVFNCKAKVEDTLIMSKVLYSTTHSHSLKYCGETYLHRDIGDKVEIEDWVKANKREYLKIYGRPPTFQDAPADIIKDRILWDVETTILLYLKLQPEVAKVCPSLYETERQLLYVCLDMENTGVLVDITRAKQLRDQAQKDLDILYRELNDLVAPLTITRKIKGVDTREKVDTFNPGSSKCHLPAAFIKMGIQLRYKTKPKKGKKGSTKKSGGGNWCFDEYAMVRYVSKELAAVMRESSEQGWSATKFHDEVHAAVKKHKLKKSELLPPLILQYRQVQKMISTYYNHLVEDCTEHYVGPDGREYGTLHCKFNQSTALTGRFCLAKGTQIQIPGATKNIEDVKVGDWVYCYDDNLNLKLKKVTWSGKTGHKKVIRVHWQGSGHKHRGYLDLTPEHQVRLTSGKYVKAINLKPMDRILALHRDMTAYKYNRVYVTGHGNYREAKLVNQLTNDCFMDHTHHKNGIKTDDRPENLVGMTHSEYSSFHSSNMSEHTKRIISKAVKKRWLDPEYRQNMILQLQCRDYIKISKEEFVSALDDCQWRILLACKKLKISYPAMVRRLKKWGIDAKEKRKEYSNSTNKKITKESVELAREVHVQNGQKAAQKHIGLGYYSFKKAQEDFSFNPIYNHEILSVEDLNKKVDVYDIEVDGEHNFIANELCIHNSSSRINLQNIPRILGPRETIVPRKGRRNYHSDYKQVEMKFFVHFSEDETMAAAINDDIHLAVAANVYGMDKADISKEQRKRAKGVNFGIIYGAGPATIAETLTKKGLPTSEYEADSFCVNYHRRFPSVRNTTKKLKNDLVNKGYIQNPFGRRYHIPSKTAYKALNYMCQGTSADLMKLSMVRIWKWLRAGNYKTKIIMTVHDEIVLEVPPSEAKIVMPKVIELMEDKTSFFVEMTVDVEVVKRRWSQKKSVNFS